MYFWRPPSSRRVDAGSQQGRSMTKVPGSAAALVLMAALVASAAGPGSVSSKEGRRLLDHEPFGGNGRTCRPCHSEQTGTVSPADAAKRFKADPNDPLFRHDG